MPSVLTTIDDFEFLEEGNGQYYVTYTSPNTGEQWSVVTSDTYLIDSTKNAYKPKTKDLNQLKYLCKLKMY